MARTMMNEHCSAVILNKLPRKLGDLRKFLIPCEFSRMDECLALADFGARINLMPLSVWEGLSLPELTPTCMTLELVDRSVSKPIGIAKDVTFKVGVFHFPADFVVVDFEPDPRVPLILRRCFLKTSQALIDVHKGELTLRIGNEAITYNLYQTVGYSANYNQMKANKIDVVESACEEYSQEEADAFLGLEDDPDSPKINPFYYDPEGDLLLLEAILNSEPSPPLPNQEQNLPSFKEELKAYEAQTVKSSVDEPPEVELKDLPHHLEYAFLEGDNKMLERLAGNENYCFLDGFSGYFQIPIDPRDQKKTTFTCPYGTFSYRRMPFGLCNALGTFQRCMLAIFHDMVKKTMEVFMDDFSVFRNSFKNCLSCLDKMLQRCEDTNLSLNWEKSHFMVKEGIVLGHKISKNRIEVDRAKVDVIAKLPHPTTVKGIRSFLCHAGFYQRFIQDFSKISRPMTHLLEKNTPFVFSEDCIRAFQTLKKKLTEAPILIAPNWDLPFELMCDASDFAIVHTDHSALKYLFAKKDAKVRLLQWVLLLQEFNFKVLDTKGAENLVADHLSRLENPYENVLDPKGINETFPLETLSMVTFHGDSSASWFADFANYHAGNFIVKDPRGEIMVQISLPKRSLMPVSSGPPFTKMPTSLLKIMNRANGKGKFRNGMKCLRIPSKLVKSLTYGALTIWARSRLHEGISIFSWQSTICQNGLKRKHLPPTTPVLFANSSNLSSPDLVHLKLS
nr:reverse transcriptase domain-containing protein [Tanacetum cinerariifolium]